MCNCVMVQCEGGSDRTIQVKTDKMPSGSKVEITCAGIGSTHSPHVVDQGAVPTSIHTSEQVAIDGIVKLTARIQLSGGSWQDLQLTFRTTSGLGSDDHEIGGRLTSTSWDQPVIILS